MVHDSGGNQADCTAAVCLPGLEKLLLDTSIRGNLQALVPQSLTDNFGTFEFVLTDVRAIVDFSDILGMSLPTYTHSGS